MVTYYLKQNSAYKVSATTECIVKDSSSNTILSCNAGETVSFKAPSRKITVSDDNAALTRIVESSGAGSSSECTEHIVNNGIHVTPTEKNGWNAHISDADIHVTVADKKRWDNAEVGAELVYDLTTMFSKTYYVLADALSDLNGYFAETGQEDKIKNGLMLKFVNAQTNFYQTWRYNGVGDVTSWVNWSLQIYYDELNATVNQLVNQAKVRPGTVEHYAGATVPDGYLLCDGSEVSRTDYAGLFAAIGTTWGEGDGSTTFALPNLIDRVIWGASTAGGYIDAGLPNITGSFYIRDAYGNKMTAELSSNDNNAFVKDAMSSGTYAKATSSPDTLSINTLNFNASLSNSIYGNSETVQPPAAKLIPIIKY